MVITIWDGESLMEHMQEIRDLDKVIDKLIFEDDDLDSAVEIMDDRNNAYLNLYEFIEECLP